jgi:YceI-like protein
MNGRCGRRAFFGFTMMLAICAIGVALPGAQTPLAIGSARITISGTSNIHAYTASTTTIDIRRAQLAGPIDAAALWTNALKPGGVEMFEVAIPAATLTSPREGLDANMHKALQVTEHPDIIFRLLRFEPRPGPEGSLRAIGNLKIAGVVREVAIDITTERKDGTLSVRGQIPLLMTDFGIKPPVALMGMLKTDAKVIVAFETVLTIPQT